ncbi:MAG: glutathione S-transferase [Pseudomonadota bacterium]
MSNHYRIVGGLGSPYSMKLRAVFRYRRLVHVFEMRNGAVREEVAHVRPQIIPMVGGPNDDDWLVDSTPIIYELETRHAKRSILPESPADRFLSELIEDFGDEWLTKAMFHYRWYYATDRDFSAYWIATDQVTEVDDARRRRRAFADQIRERQVTRMPLVGCTEENRPVIEQSYQAVLDALEPLVGFGQFLFGTRPSIGDFGLFGQLKTLADDPTPMFLMRQRSPTVCHWVRQVDDLSGIDGVWRDEAESYSDPVRDLLSLCGAAYLPFLAANSKAIEADADSVRVEIWGHPYSQAPFRYQGKCYSRLKALFAGLSADARRTIEPVLEETDCLRWLV